MPTRLSRQQAATEAARCLMCHEPPCEEACPAHVGVSTFLRRMRFADFPAAWRKIVETNVLAGTCGMTCPQGMLCEEACVLRPGGTPIRIRDLQLAAHLYGADARGWPRVETARAPKRPQVAILGSGPAGLACGYYLRGLGLRTTLYEKHRLLGGMLTRGIPAHRVGRDVVAKEIGLATQALAVVPGAEARGLTRAGLRKRGFGAIFLATGLWETGDLDVSGRDLEGVWDGAELLAELAEHRRGRPKLAGRVAVVGGGNTACDVALSLKRRAACDVTIFYRRTRDQMPAFPHEIDEALLAGVRLEFLVAPLAVVGKRRAEGLVLERMRLGRADSSGRPRPTAVRGSEFTVACDHVVLATGGQLDRRWLDAAFGLAPGKSGRVDVNPKTMMTEVDGVFAGGDLVRDKGLVVQAVADGRRAALAIADYLGVAR
jgi:NADPH-dependent glutamate synthase beta subunit-like oxidoreductase